VDPDNCSPGSTCSSASLAEDGARILEEAKAATEKGDLSFLP